MTDFFNRLFAKADEYLAESDWRDLALIKFCLCAMGVIIGVSVGQKQKKPVLLTALGIFAVTYVLLMTKFVKILLRKDECSE